MQRNYIWRTEIHPERDEKNKIYCSAGSLGMGITVSVGMALADFESTIHCVISDGECAEGSVWESLKFIYESHLKNIKIYTIINGYTGLDSIDTEYLIRRLKAFLPEINIIRTSSDFLPSIHGVLSHYHVLNNDTYNIASNLL